MRVDRPTVKRPTPRQVVVLKAFVEGGGYRGAAGLLGCPVGTIKHTLYDLRRRLDVTTEQAIAVGIRDGWLVVGLPNGSLSTDALSTE